MENVWRHYDLGPAGLLVVRERSNTPLTVGQIEELLPLLAANAGVLLAELPNPGQVLNSRSASIPSKVNVIVVQAAQSWIETCRPQTGFCKHFWHNGQKAESRWITIPPAEEISVVSTLTQQLPFFVVVTVAVGLCFWIGHVFLQM